MNIRLASAPVSWGIFEFADIQPRYPYGTVLDEIAQTGYAGTELGPYGYLPTDPVVLRQELAARDLRLVSAFVPVPLARPESHAEGLARALQVGRLLRDVGASTLILADDNGSVPELVARAGRRNGCWSLDFRTIGRGVDFIASSVADELGLKVAFHHHCAGVVETPDEVEALLDISSVGLCLDTGHWHYAGGDAVECLRRFGSRVTYLHLKDCDAPLAERCRREQLDYFAAVKAGVFCALGDGCVDFRSLLLELQRLDYDGWAVVEQDVLVDDLDAPRRFSLRNREVLRRLGL